MKENSIFVLTSSKISNLYLRINAHSRAVPYRNEFSLTVLLLCYRLLKMSNCVLGVHYTKPLS